MGFLTGLVFDLGRPDQRVLPGIRNDLLDFLICVFQLFLIFRLQPRSLFLIIESRYDNRRNNIKTATANSIASWISWASRSNNLE